MAHEPGSNGLPDAIEVVELPGDGIVYHLPIRRFGCVTVFGVVLGLVGLATAGGGGLLLATSSVIDQEPWVKLLLGLGALLVLALGMAMVLGGLTNVLGHTVIRLEDGQLASVLKIGPIPLRDNRRNLVDIRRLAIIADGEQKTICLAASCADSPPIELASRYPCDWLEHLGHDLASRCNAARGELVQPIEVEAECRDFTGDRPVQPVMSGVATEEIGDRLTLRIPPAGWSLVATIALGLVASTFAGIGFVLATLTVLPPWFRITAAGLAPLLIVGVSMLALYFARRRLTLEVSGETLKIIQTGLWTAQKIWHRSDLVAIRAVRELRKQETQTDSGTQVQYVWVTELQIHPKVGRPTVLSGRYGLLPGGFEQDWEWMATRLRGALDVSS